MRKAKQPAEPMKLRHWLYGLAASLLGAAALFAIVVWLQVPPAHWNRPPASPRHRTFTVTIRETTHRGEVHNRRFAFTSDAPTATEAASEAQSYAQSQVSLYGGEVVSVEPQ